MLAVPLVLAKSRVYPAVNDLAPPNILANHIVPGFEISFNFVTNFMFEAHFECFDRHRQMNGCNVLLLLYYYYREANTNTYIYIYNQFKITH